MLIQVNRSTRIVAGLALVTLAAFILRMIGLADVPPRWDEGWTIAHASLSLGDIFTITSADVHPPLFYMLLGAWQQLIGVNLFADRYLAVLMSLPVAPLVYAVAVAWNPDRSARPARLAFIAAICMAWLPLAVYYSAVVRMYALAPTFVLLATWAGLRLISVQRRHNTTGLSTVFVVGASGAMLTLYHAAWALIALGLYGFILALRRRRLRALSLAAGLSAILYLPWALYAIPQLLGRAAAESGNIAQGLPVSLFLKLGVEGLSMAQATSGLGVPVIAGVLIIGLASAFIGVVRKTNDSTAPVHAVSGWTECVAALAAQLAPLTLPVLMIVLTLFGVAVAARNWAFSARMVVCATPALALLLAWSLDRMIRQSRILAAGAALVLAAVYFSTSASFVYQKTLEVFDPYNPHTYFQHIAPKAKPDDLVIFNVLSPAGFYALDRRSNDPTWSYALTWDPVIEPRMRWEQRIQQAAALHARLWVVLYRGLAGKNGDLRGWLDTNLFPAAAEWGEEGVFYGLYGTVHEPLVSAQVSHVHWRAPDGFDLELRTAQTAATVRTGEIIPVALTWRADSPLKQSYKVFVHAFDDSGDLVAQHDAQPLNDLRPMPSLPVGADVVDHHGLAPPAAFTGRLRIVVGVYDPATNQRILTADGRDSVDLGAVAVTAAP
ncbi:MAG: hypothetical protein M1434_13715 [Chloroflexi bacterium]|nr:hypothetical protein [Chloroflexota bacterium]MCL5275779.1 hypothetical protein [Chloroflexota bacterium]